MGRYRKIDTCIWGDARFRTLSRAPDNAQTLWFYLLTGPHTTALPGLFSETAEGIASRLEWFPEGFRERFRELSAEGMAEADWQAGVVWVPNVVKWDPPLNPNGVTAWWPCISSLPECQLVGQALQRLREWCEQRGEGFAEAFRKGFRERFGERYPELPSPSPSPSPSPEEVSEATPPHSTQPEADPSPGSSEHGSPNLPAAEQPTPPAKTKPQRSARLEAAIERMRPLGFPDTADPRRDLGPWRAACQGLSPEEAVFIAWCLLAGKSPTRAVFREGGKRHRKVKAALEGGYSAADLVQAIRGCLMSPHNRGANETGTVYDELELMVRDEIHVERYRQIAEGKGLNGAGMRFALNPRAAAEEDLLQRARQAELAERHRFIPEESVSDG